MDEPEASSSTGNGTPVVVVGAGPVGAVLALELAHHGVPCTVLERSVSPSRHPKMDYVNGRSMELLRRLDLAREIREQGIPGDLASDFLWIRDFREPPIAVWPHESPVAAAERFADVTDGSAPLEPYQRMQGNLLETVVRRRARESPLIDLREGWTVTAVDQDSDGVTVTVVDPTATRRTIQTRYVAACDGASSAVRQDVDIPIDVIGPTTLNCSVYFRSSDPTLRSHGRAFVTIAARGLTLVSRDEANTWTASFPVPANESGAANHVRTLNERLGAQLTVEEVLSVAQWEGSLGVAKTYRHGSVFLVGDAAHQFYPTGGYGANTGLADAVDLGWKLAASIKGWGGPRLLDSYEIERRPVALFNREMCLDQLEVWRRFSRLDAIGASREHLAGFLEQQAYQINNLGIHFAYRYTGSPVIWPDSGQPPAWHWPRITPSTWPGSRVPAIRLTDGTPLFDLLGTDLTLVDLHPEGTGRYLAKEADRRDIPVSHLPIGDRVPHGCWEHDLVLVRPDQHVAWHGNGRPDDWDAILDHVRGW